jgi:hypothetical protein
MLTATGTPSLWVAVLSAIKVREAINISVSIFHFSFHPRGKGGPVHVEKNEMGSLEPGKFADIVFLNSDPLSDIHITTKIDTVLLRGRMFRPDMLWMQCSLR